LGPVQASRQEAQELVPLPAKPPLNRLDHHHVMGLVPFGWSGSGAMRGINFLK
jgi:hypothetical protein